jgi:hypothetical protein
VNVENGADRVAQVVEQLPSKCEALSSNPNTAKKENQMNVENVFNSFECIPRIEIARSYGNSMFDFWENFQTVSYSSCTILHFHQ